jgi:plastocyanin
MTHSKLRIVLGSACLLALIAPACSSDDKSTTTVAPAESSATGAGPAALTISGNTFSPAAVTAGTEFTITNNDSVGHTVTDDAGSFDVSVPAGGSETLTIPTAGSYAIHCEIHNSMHGTITVA